MIPLLAVFVNIFVDSVPSSWIFILVSKIGKKPDSSGVSRSNLIVEWQLLRHLSIYSACSLFLASVPVSSM